MGVIQRHTQRLSKQRAGVNALDQTSTKKSLKRKNATKSGGLHDHLQSSNTEVPNEVTCK